MTEGISRRPPPSSSCSSSSSSLRTVDAEHPHGKKEGTRTKRDARTYIIVFGASGDLTSRKVMPALCSLFKAGLLEESTRIVGVARSKLDDDKFRKKIHSTVSEFSRLKIGTKDWSEISDRLRYIQGEYDDPQTYETIAQRTFKSGARGRIDNSSSRRRGEAAVNCLFYLSVPPSLFPVVTAQLGASGLSREEPGRGWRRVIIEKPFGRDLQSARSLNSQIQRDFKDSQIYRIDHYLGKETVQNVLTFRFANAIFEPIWNRNYIDNVQITMGEDVGVEHRAGYYEQAGVVRDMVQNHILQLVSFAAMEAPPVFGESELRDEKVKVLRAVSRIDPRTAIFGQYSGYRHEEKVDRRSLTPTFVAFRLFIDNWRWQGVPFYVRTGKKLARKCTEISLKFKRVPHLLFREDHDLSPNRISLCIQPDEGIHLIFEVQSPGMELKTTRASLQFQYDNTFGKGMIPEAYERLLLDALHGNPLLFTREDEVELAWKVVDPLLHTPEQKKTRGSGAPRLHTYGAGSWGPAEADAMLERDGRAWQLSCDQE